MRCRTRTPKERRTLLPRRPTAARHRTGPRTTGRVQPHLRYLIAGHSNSDRSKEARRGSAPHPIRAILTCYGGRQNMVTSAHSARRCSVARSRLAAVSATGQHMCTQRMLGEVTIRLMSSARCGGGRGARAAHLGAITRSDSSLRRAHRRVGAGGGLLSSLTMPRMRSAQSCSHGPKASRASNGSVFLPAFTLAMKSAVQIICRSTMV